MNIVVAPLTASDQAVWLPLWAGYLRFYQHELDSGQTLLTFARMLEPDYEMWGALAHDDQGRAVGFVHWLTHPSTWAKERYVYLEDLFVAEDVRGGGVGRALIAHVTEWARERHLPKVYWQTASDNQVARRLYDQVAKTEFIVYEIDLDERR